MKENKGWVKYVNTESSKFYIFIKIPTCNHFQKKYSQNGKPLVKTFIFKIIGQLEKSRMVEFPK